ncbi:hypothetical protein [Micromonospora zamorensis]|uniref:hypothetical protein n=1 Tax=Micromonospora zamorensis TaxID=709883 RepID=UPI0008200A23|nr:hypothetical protein [Micromonospora zamorensis]SCG61885.1 hypothetical protein GA0070619_4470 [Micromonospora zamorensis]
MSVDPTAPLPEPVPETRAYPPIDPWAAEPPTAPLPTTAPPAAAASDLPPTTPFPVAPAPAQFSPPAQFSAPPAPFSGPPAQPAGAWPAVGPYPPTPMAVPPALAGYASGPEVVAVQIAEIAVSPPVIRTPAGVLPLAGATWHVADYWQREEKVATWALICAIVGFFCLFVLSLLFLLVKETRHHGTVQVTVTNGAQQYVARIPVADQAQVQHLNNQVNYARSLSSR